MADVGAWSAAATATAAAISSLIGAARQPADVAALRSEVKASRAEVVALIATAVDAVKVAVDASLAKARTDLTNVARRVEALEKWREKHRAPAPESTRAPMTSGPELLAATDKEHERRIAALEGRADRVDGAVMAARETLAGIVGRLDGFIGRGGRS